ncbi:relaxase/mobilization nuclease domain-containing protein [Fusibacter ferrireducens]|uniref:Relaxase/mobilization nuclease domain-containing protein n=1 Tax=Fusibacter ferrireducens TaxID=2785058 RepID=A0ABR9ZPB8_9FIRM|nr:relaxase/mobilization nuclease domain-containing protein [Fusibacter ferrireducens]MBF4692306.1 relaxase/mobilization nuclease domain-containing protein [Fusibacter ferrireducens]
MAVIEFINGKNNTLSALERVLKYITNPAKTEETLKGGHNCGINTAYNEFFMTKSEYSKLKGRQYIHFTQSFAPYDKVTPAMVKQIADELVQMEAFKGFQVAYAVHTDRDHLHTHFVVNTVNMETGMKWKQSAEQLQMMKDNSDEICKKYGLILTQGKSGSRVNRGEYRSKENSHSWKYELYLTVKKVKWIARSKEEFVANMNALGYQVDWSDTRKYITFTNSEGKKCRNRKLYPPEHFTKEALLKAFELNSQRMEARISRSKMEMLLSAVQLVKMDNQLDASRSNYPLSTIEREALKEKIEESKKGKGLNWDKESENSM